MPIALPVPSRAGGRAPRKIDPPLLDEGVALKWFQGHSLLLLAQILQAQLWWGVAQSS